MIKLIFEQEEEYIDDFVYPKKSCEVTISDEDTLNTLFFELVKLAQYAGYTITNETWDSIKEYINNWGGFMKSDSSEFIVEYDGDEEEEMPFPFN